MGGPLGAEGRAILLRILQTYMISATKSGKHILITYFYIKKVTELTTSLILHYTNNCRHRLFICYK